MIKCVAMRLKWVALTLVLALLCAPTALSEAAERCDRMILVYMVGSDLEDEGGMASRDIQEMLDSGFDEERICVLLMAGGSNSWELDIPATENCIYRLVDGEMREIASLADSSMGDASTMEAFLKFGAAYADAQERSLILWDHGYGPMEGFGRDTRHGDACLTLRELTQALEGAQARLDWIGFDACLMNSIETACTLAPYADYLVASQETEPGEGWNYGFLGQLTPEMGSDAVGACIVSAYFDHYAAKYADYEQLMPLLSMSCVDLTAMGEADDALDALFTQLAEDIGNELYSDIARARMAARSVGVFTTLTEYDLVDLIDCIDELSDLYPDACARARRAVERCIICGRSNVEGLNGVSVYFPYDNIPLFLSRWGGTGEAIGCCEGYRNFLHEFALLWLQERLDSWRSPAAVGDGAAWSLHLTDEQLADYASARYVVLQRFSGAEEALRPVFYGYDLVIDGNDLIAPFDGRILCAVSGSEAVPVIAVKRGEDSSSVYYHCYVTLESGVDDYSSRKVTLQIILDKQSGEYRLAGLIDGDSSGLSTGKQSLDLSGWKSLRSIGQRAYPSMDARGNVLPLEDWRRDGQYYGYSLDIEQGLSFELRDLDAPNSFGGYELLIEVVGTRGECIASGLMDIEIGGVAADAEGIEAVELRYDGAPLDLVDSGDVLIRLDDMTWQEGFSMDFTLKNRRETNASVSIEAIAFNGVAVNDYGLDFFALLNAGAQEQLTIGEGGRDILRQAGVASPLTCVDLLLRERDRETGEELLHSLHIACALTDGGAGYLALPRISRYDGPVGEVYADENLTVEYVAAGEGSSNRIVQLRLQNRSGRYIYIEPQSLAVDGCMLDGPLGIYMTPDSSALYELDLNYGDLLRLGAGDAMTVSTCFEAKDLALGEPLFATGEMTISLNRREETALFDESGLRLGYELESLKPVAGNLLDFLYINVRNDGLSNMQINFSDVRVNGVLAETSRIKVPPQRQILRQGLYISNGNLGLTGELTSLTADVEIWNMDYSTRIVALDDVVFYAAE